MRVKISIIIFAMNLMMAKLAFCQTFPGQAPLPFPPTGTVGITESTASVSGVGVLGGCVQIDNVTLDLTHSFVGDIAIFLIAPDGTTFIELFSQNGGGGDNLQITEFRDDAPLNIVSGAPPYNGEFQPEGRQNTTLLNPYPNTNPPGTFTFANTFNGINADGDWTLYLNDFVGLDAGVLNAWSITFTSNGTSLTVNAGDDQTICAGETVTLSATPNGADTYSWSSGGNTQNIDVSPTVTTVYTVTVTDGACQGTDEVEVEVVASPQAFPASLETCDLGSGTGNFNLTSLDNTVNGGSGLVVNWFTDASALNPIGTPGNFISPPTSVYAVVGSPPCISAPVEVELILSNGPDYTLFDVSADPLESCGPVSVNFDFTPPGSSTYFVETLITLASGGSFVATWNISTGFFSFFVTETINFDIMSITDDVTGCTTSIPPGTFSIDVTIFPETEIFINPPDPICEGETIDLNDYAFTNGPNGLSFHDDFPPSPANELPSTLVTLTASQTFYVFAEGSVPGCDATEPLEVEVNPIQTVTLDVGETCEHDQFDLTTLFTGPVLDGEWSGTGVNGIFLDPTGLTGSVTVNFVADEDCILPASTDVDIIPSVIITLDETEMCANAPVFDLEALEDPLYPDGTWSGEGVFANLFNPAGLEGEISLTFIGNYQCALPSETTITVNPIIIPQLGALDYCENELPFDLSFLEDPQYPGGTWTGDGVDNNLFDPTGLNGVINLTYEVNAPCSEVSETFINILELETPDIDDTYWCPSVGVLDLNDIEDPNYSQGSWSGPGVNNNFFDPTGLTGDVELNFQSSTYCVEAVDVIVSLIDAGVPQLQEASICETETSFDLEPLQDPLFNNGYWSGQGVVNGTSFNATGLSGNIEIEFISNDGCVENGVTTIEIEQAYAPVLQDTTLCESTAVFDLSLLQDPLVASGVWSGQGVNNNIFNANGLSGLVNLTFVPGDNCATTESTNISIQPISFPALKDTVICENAGLLSLSNLNLSNFQTGQWLGQGIINDTFYPNNLAGLVEVSFVSSAACTDTVGTTIQINETINVSNVNVVCNDVDNTFTVSFEIENGLAGSYIVNGQSATSSYISLPFASLANYNFFISDANECNVIELKGTKNCTCATNAGTMAIEPQVARVCVSDIYTAVHNADQTLDDDTLLFVLHDNPGFALGNVLSVSDKPEFGFPANGELGKTYYISPVAGNALAEFIDPQDPCFSVSAGSPVQFYEIRYNGLPQQKVCVSNCADYQLNLQGQAPFKIYITIEKQGSEIKDTLDASSQLFNFTICPDDYNINEGLYNVIIVKVEDKNCENSLAIPASFLDVTPERLNNIKEDLCKGEVRVVAGNVYDEFTLAGVEVIPGGPGNCDSIINVDLQLILPSIVDLNRQLCEGEVLVVNGTVYDANNLTGTEKFFKAAANGCDSVVNVTINYTSAITNEVNEKLCSGQSLEVNGKQYDETNASGVEILPGASSGGCDSIITVSLSFLPNSNSELKQWLCRGESVVVNGNTYNFDNPFGQEVLFKSAANGCDSLINIDLAFYPEAKSTISSTICKDEVVEVDGEVFDITKPSGEVLTKSIFGCDSTINVNLSFFNDAISQRQDFICENDSVVFNGTVFNINNPQGQFLLENASVNGCDSTILFQLNFYPVSYDTVTYELFYGDSIEVDGITLSEFNPKAETVISNEGEFGCDLRRVLLLEFIKKEINIIFPNIINPSSNTGNGTFELYTTDDFIPLEMAIYDRWGNKVFGTKASSGLVNAWDGKVNGENIIPGVYVYHISYLNANGETQSVVGDVTVVR